MLLFCNIHFPGLSTKTTKTYFTNIARSSATSADNASVDGFIVKKLAFTVDGDGIQWTMSQDSFKANVEKIAFASGVTKKAYKVWCIHLPSSLLPYTLLQNSFGLVEECIVQSASTP
jgi:hypothetical protein